MDSARSFIEGILSSFRFHIEIHKKSHISGIILSLMVGARVCPIRGRLPSQRLPPLPPQNLDPLEKPKGL